MTKDNIAKENVIYSMTSKLTKACESSINLIVQKNVYLSHISKSPCILKKDSFVITFDGILYNSQELKEELNVIDSLTTINNTTELVLLAFIQYGYKFLEHLDGSFALAIYDTKKEELLLARDRLGIKPLYYTNKEDFIFGSEIKNILGHPNVKAIIKKDEVCEIFGLGPAHSPGKTFFNDIFEVLPGSYILFSKNECKSFTYWDLETEESKDTIQDNILKIHDFVTDSLENQLTDDSLCCMLSGGLDSSILSYLTAKKLDNLTTFSIDFVNNDTNYTKTSYQPSRDNEYIQIMQNYIKSNHICLSFSCDELLNNLKDSVIARDMPGMADIDSSMLVFCNKIKEAGYTTAISGECSDEIFGGYPWYYSENLMSSKNFPWSRAIEVRKKIVSNEVVSDEYLDNYIQNAYNSTCKNVVYNSSDEKENAFRRTCYLTIKWFMNTLIERTDRMSNISGLNVRIPFANYKIFEYVYNISYKNKLGLINNNNIPIEKYLLRKAFENELPDEIAYRKKSPFPKTYDPKYLEALEKMIEDIIRDSTSPLLEIINVKYLLELLDNKGDSLTENWFGQLMTYPQMLAYLIEVNIWLKKYNIIIDID